jgi:hypothetical protein
MNYNITTNFESGTRVTVRLADYGDSAALVRLAGLDSASFPEGPTLVAEVDGEIQAALPVDGGPVIADPFRSTTGLVEILRLRADHLRGDQPKVFASPRVGRAVSALRRPHLRPS